MAQSTSLCMFDKLSIGGSRYVNLIWQLLTQILIILIYFKFLSKQNTRQTTKNSLFIIFSIFIRAILSWFSGTGYTPVLRLLHTFTEPVLNIFRRLLPVTGGLDFSPIAVFIVLMVVLKIIVQPILDFSRLILIH